jgi:non-heme chloroperoxidase
VTTQAAITELRVEGAGGVGLHIATAGPADGIPTMLLHGQLASGRCWQRLVTGPAADVLRLVAPDYRGHGRSDRPSTGYEDTDVWGADMRAVAETLELDRPVLVGWSHGGAIACDYLRQGGSARGIVLVDAGLEAGADNPKAAITWHPNALAIFLKILSDDPQVAVEGIHHAIRSGRERPIPHEEFLASVGDAVLVSNAARDAILARSFDNDDVLASFDGPILQIHGERDRIRLPSAALRRNPLFRNGRTEIWPDCGHAPFLDEPERFAAALVEFARRVP